MCSRDSSKKRVCWKNDYNPALMIREAEAELNALWTLQVTSVLSMGATDERLYLAGWILG